MAADDRTADADGGMQAWLGLERCAAAFGAARQWPQALSTLVGLMCRSGCRPSWPGAPS